MQARQGVCAFFVILERTTVSDRIPLGFTIIQGDSIVAKRQLQSDRGKTGIAQYISLIFDCYQ